MGASLIQPCRVREEGLRVVNRFCQGRKVRANTSEYAHMRREVKFTSIPIEQIIKIELKSLILAQIERWRHALHMQVERQHGGNPGGEWRTGE